MRVSTLIILVTVLAGIAVLCGLGFWQVQRLGEKQALIERVESRRNSEPVPLAEIEALAEQSGNIDYRPVTAAGRFDHRAEQYYYVTRDGVVGWHVYTPLVLDDGRVLIVNRGFVPEQLRDPERRRDGLPAARVTLTGLARSAPAEKPNRFIPDNEPENAQYFWRDLEAMAVEMARRMEQEQAIFLPFAVDAAKRPGSAGWPLGGATRIAFPNNHLQYAITWFGLALALLGVGSYFLYARRSVDGEREAE